MAVREDYAAPTGLEFVLDWGSTNRPHLRRSGAKRRRAAAVQDAGAKVGRDTPCAPAW